MNTTNNEHGEYNNSFILNGREIYFRKWKVKDRIALEKAESQSDVRQNLVYNCIEDKTIVFDDYEYQYVLIKLRQASIGDEITYHFSCEHCQTPFEYVSSLEETMEPIMANYAPIEVPGYKIEVGPVHNRKAYEKELFSISDISTRKIADFAMHIIAINGNRKYGFRDIMDILVELDVDTFQNIWNAWNQMHFRLNRVHRIECPHCNSSMLVTFDDLPGFFPEKWNMR